MTGWHIDEETLVRYVEGGGRLSVDASVEAHLLRCGRCRALVAPTIQLNRLERLWGDVVQRVDAPRPLLPAEGAPVFVALEGW